MASYTCKIRIHLPLTSGLKPDKGNSGHYDHPDHEDRADAAG